MKRPDEEYRKLHQIARETQVLQGISRLLDWDQETYMPPAAAGIRADQFQVLAGVIHQHRVSRQFSQVLNKLIDLKSGKVKAQGLNPAKQAALREWRHDYLHEKALPKRFVEEFARLTSQSMHAWRHAREQNAFLQFAPFLENIVNMMRKKADLLGYKDHPYDALLDEYERGMTIRELVPLFSQLQKNIVPLLKKITASKQADNSFLFGSFDSDQQIAFGKVILQAMHYDLSKGRLDLSTHPFSSATHPTDSRITTRIHPNGLMSNIFSVLHEAGHGLYEMGLPEEEYGTPLGESLSLGMHESQSRWWETIIGHSKPFWSYFLPLLKNHFPQLKDVTLDRFHRAINRVSPGFIRIESDEVTYNLHIVLRFEMERALIEGKLKVRELPEAWNAKMQELLGISPKNNQEGCLQDIHWSMGAFGYFPTYTLGNLYGAQLFEGFAKDYPDWEKRVAKGEFLFMKQWLNDSVHKHGKRYTSKELVKKVTGKPFTADAFIRHLKGRHGHV